jgi:hypothetical protein
MVPGGGASTMWGPIPGDMGGMGGIGGGGAWASATVAPVNSTPAASTDRRIVRSFG